MGRAHVSQESKESTVQRTQNQPYMKTITLHAGGPAQGQGHHRGHDNEVITEVMTTRSSQKS